MTLRIHDVIAIPPTKPPLVVKVGEINDEERKAFRVARTSRTPWEG